MLGVEQRQRAQERRVSSARALFSSAAFRGSAVALLLLRDELVELAQGLAAVGCSEGDFAAVDPARLDLRLAAPAEKVWLAEGVLSHRHESARSATPMSEVSSKCVTLAASTRTWRRIR